MKQQDPFGFIGAINNIPKDKKSIDKIHKVLFKNKTKKHFRESQFEQAKRFAKKVNGELRLSIFHGEGMWVTY